MKFRILVSCAALYCTANGRAADGGSNDERTCAFVDVNVLPMDREVVLQHQTVVVRDGKISVVGRTAVTVVPTGAEIIEGKDRYLIPGLTDIHIHLPDHNEKEGADELKMFLFNGITVAVNMRGSPEILNLRNQVNAGKILGPTFYTTGPYVNEPEFKTSEEFRKEVIAQVKMGYDFIKVHGDVSREAFPALIHTAEEQHIRVLGHVPLTVGLEETLGNFAEVVHAEEFLYSYFQLNRDLPTDPAEIQQMVTTISKKVKQSGTWISPTLAVFREIIYQTSDIDSVSQRTEMKYMPLHIREEWGPVQNVYVRHWPVDKVPYFRAEYRVMQALTKGLHDAGVPLLAGSDCMVSGVIPGFSYDDELSDLVGAGLTPYEALRAATATASQFLKIEDSYGTITPGKRADLVLLSANPLDNISNVSRPEGVMLHGRWLNHKELEKGWNELAATYQK